jgi:hypothetical protein
MPDTQEGDIHTGSKAISRSFIFQHKESGLKKPKDIELDSRILKVAQFPAEV